MSELNTLIIEGINWFDGRMQDQKVYLIESLGDEIEDTLEQIGTDERGIWFIGSRGEATQRARLAQGDKTAFNHKGQPLPDGVIVKIWNAGLKGSTTLSVEKADWSDLSDITHFQVVEQIKKSFNFNLEVDHYNDFGQPQYKGEPKESVASATMARIDCALKKARDNISMHLEDANWKCDQRYREELAELDLLIEARSQ